LHGDLYDYCARCHYHGPPVEESLASKRGVPRPNYDYKNFLHYRRMVEVALPIVPVIFLIILVFGVRGNLIAREINDPGDRSAFFIKLIIASLNKPPSSRPALIL